MGTSENIRRSLGAVVIVASICIADHAAAQTVVREQVSNSLGADFAAVRKESGRSDRWIGYSFVRRMERGSMVGTFAIGGSDHHVELGDWIAGRVGPSSPKEAAKRELDNLRDEDEIVEKPVAVLVRVSGSDNQISRVRYMTMSSLFDPDGLDLHWLGAREDAQSYDLLLAIYKEASSPKLRKSVTYAIGFHDDDDRVVPFLKNLASSSDEEDVAKAAVYSLGNQSGTPVTTFLADIARSSRPTAIRKSAVYSLGNREDETSIDALTEIVSDAAVGIPIRKASLYALANCAAPEALATVRAVATRDTEVELAKAATYSLSQVEESSVPMLLEVLRETQHAAVRKAAVYAIGNVESHDAVEALKWAVASDYDSEVRKAAVYALGNIGTDEARDALKAILSN